MDAGFETNAVYFEIPYHERTGVIFGGVPQPGNSKSGASNPRISLISAAADDPRSGYLYSSLASGKVVLVPGPRGGEINIQIPNVAPNHP